MTGFAHDATSYVCWKNAPENDSVVSYARASSTCRDAAYVDGTSDDQTANGGVLIGVASVLRAVIFCFRLCLCPCSCFALWTFDERIQ